MPRVPRELQRILVPKYARDDNVFLFLINWDDVHALHPEARAAVRFPMP